MTAVRKRYVRVLLLPALLALSQRFLDLAGAPSEMPAADLLLNAVAGKITSNSSVSFVLAVEHATFLFLFLLLFGDMVAEQQRTGAVYIFPRMPSRTRWYVRQTLALGGCAFAYCGVYLLCHAAISGFISAEPGGARALWEAAARLWIVFSVIVWALTLAGNLLCGRFGASVGTVVCVVPAILLLAASMRPGLSPRAMYLNPVAMSEEIFTSLRSALIKFGVLCAELAVVFAAAGWYFCTKDIFSAEGEG